MLREAFEFLIGQAEGKAYIAGDGREYTTRPIHPVKPPVAEPVVVASLTGLIEFLASDLDGLEPSDWFVHVRSPREVAVCSAMNTKWMVRQTALKAVFSGGTHFPFGRYQGQEDAIVGLQTGFAPSDTLFELMGLVGNIKDEAVGTQVDDGVSQVVTVRKGAALVSQATARSRWNLRPYRTWPEIEQCELECILRLKKGPEVALFAVEDPGWEFRAMEAAAFYLQPRVPMKVVA